MNRRSITLLKKNSQWFNLFCALDYAADEKRRLEEKQRAVRKERTKKKEEFVPR